MNTPLRPTFLKIHLDHIAKNFHFFNQIENAQQFMCPMVKANAYGHGDVAVVRHLSRQGCTTFGVGLVEEGLRLRESGLLKENILVFGFYGQEAIKEILRAQLVPVVSDWEQFHGLLDEIKRQGLETYPIHLKINTGMNRLGFTLVDLEKLLTSLQQAPALQVVGVGTHLMTSEDLSEIEGSAAHQLQCFSQVLQKLRLKKCALHAYNTSGALYAQRKTPATAPAPYGLRIGIGMYGYASIALDQSQRLYPSMSFLSKVVSLQNVKKNEVVSYGGTWRAAKDSLIGIVPAGYADGIPTQLSNKGYVKISGQEAPIVGRVCMDYTLIDVSHIKSAHNAEVEFFGTELSAHKVAEISGTITYDVLTRISERVPRVYSSSGFE